jgi:hypothetical protein
MMCGVNRTEESKIHHGTVYFCQGRRIEKTCLKRYTWITFYFFSLNGRQTTAFEI